MVPATWRDLLKGGRQRLKLTQKALGARVGLSGEAIRSYERGTRIPARLHLRRLIEELRLPEAEANEIFRQLDVAPRETLFSPEDYPTYFFTVEELQNHVETVTWPEFVLNNLGEVVAANRMVQAIWQIDFEVERRRRSAAQLNPLSIIAEPYFAQSIVNWDEAAATLIAVAKGQPGKPASLEEPSPYLQRIFEEFVKHDPAYLPRLLDLWAKTPAREAKVRWSYPVVWRDPEFGELRFSSVISTASEPDALGFNDWIPAGRGDLVRTRTNSDCSRTSLGLNRTRTPGLDGSSERAQTGGRYAQPGWGFARPSQDSPRAASQRQDVDAGGSRGRVRHRQGAHQPDRARPPDPGTGDAASHLRRDVPFVG